ncbi:NUDIX hydrolase [Aquabacterium sp.]|uniref:NUDIX hydrolase n=1 Tax=Aquabacterium sp. TaxID=1872578 RepID=UPI002C790561|nr:NUDIX domain-containing protein [Aquabacterium sp.]HSW05945.1 NUDIX domain-containing protein [Aquabacterium sp.]
MHETPASLICTVDVVLLTLQEGALAVLLQRREREPFKAAPALPGGYIHVDEDAGAAAAAVRVLRDKTGIVSPYLEQLATFSGPVRDPRGWSVSIVYYALLPGNALPADALLAPVDRLPQLPFDHAAIVARAVDRVRTKSQYSSLPVYLCGERFTLPQLQGVYEAVLGEPVNKVSFRRKVEELGMLEPIEGELSSGAANRPAQLYRLRKAFRQTLSITGRGLNGRS